MINEEENNHNDPLSKSLNLIPYIEGEIKLPIVTDKNSQENLSSDFETARSNIENILKQVS